MGLEFNPLVVVGAAALCCAFIAFAVARRTVAARVVLIDTRNRPAHSIGQQKPELSDLIVVPLGRDVLWKNLQVSYVSILVSQVNE